MNDPLEEAKEVLKDLERGLESAKTIWAELRELNPNLEQLSEKNLTKQQAKSWLHGATDAHECIELEKWLHISLPLSKIAKSRAILHYRNWADFILENGIYADFFEVDLIHPEKSDNLYDYIWRLAKHVQKNGWGSKKNKRALRSFLSFLRKEIPTTDIGFIEQIFPEKMNLRHGSLIRLNRPQVYPISEEIAGEIIHILAMKAAYRQPNAQLKNAEALALCWLCLTVSRLRLPTTLERIHSISKKAIILMGDTSFIKIPTIFGQQKQQLSQRTGKYLQAIANIASASYRKTIIQSTLHDLRRTLKSAIQKANVSPEYGEITFLTFMSSPHRAGKNVRPGKHFLATTKTVP